MSDLKLGLSGCKIEQVSDCIIRKYSKDTQYNDRLLKQINKQIGFVEKDDFTTPKILNVSKGDLFYFDMQYSSGKNYSQYFDHCSVSDVERFQISICKLITNQYTGEFYDPEHVKNIIFEKLFSLKQKSNYLDFIDCILNNFHIINFHGVPKSFCHGDLSLSNILFDKKYILIDFLDSFIDTIIVDLVKLKQDLYYNWCLETQSNNSARIKIIFSYLWYNINDYFKDITSLDVFELLDLINLLRIEPYVNQKNKEILSRLIESHKYHVNFNNSNGRIFK